MLSNNTRSWSYCISLVVTVALGSGMPNIIAQSSSKKAAPAPQKSAAAPAKAAPAATAGHSTSGATVTTGARTTGPMGTAPGSQKITTSSVGNRASLANHNASFAAKPNVVPGVTHGPLTHPAARGEVEHNNAYGAARVRSDGRPADVHNARLNMDVHHNLAGGRRIETIRPDGRRFVYERGRPGYIGRPYSFHGHDFERRAYYDHGRIYNRYYGVYGYRGYNMHVYAPGRYYPPAYYGWAYYRWGAPVHYGWGFEGRPWYGYYHAYYTPYAVYPTASLWLTDYMLSQTLAAAYQAHQDAGSDAGPAQAAYAGPALSPEAKQMIANEVQADIQYESGQATTNQQQGIPDTRTNSVARLMEDGKSHVFLAGREVDVVDASGMECSITDGDVVQLPAGPANQAPTANVIVLASKGDKDCAPNAQVAIGVDELQEMDNHMREQVDSGLQDLAAKQGTNGLPAAPAAALAAPSDAVVAQGAPPADPNGAQELAQQDAQAQQAEKEVLGAAGSTSPASPQPASNEDLFKPQ